ncbi:MAG: thioredoxin domain-containing protein [Bryobacteraceae bacterium]
MSRLLPFIACLSLLALAAGAGDSTKSALDKATLEAYVRHLYVLDQRIQVTISDPKPAPLAGFVEETVHASLGKQSQDFTFYISQDGKHILQGTVYDVNANPFKADLDKIKTMGAPGWGTSGAPVVLVEFSDFECPYCKEEAQQIRDNLLATYPTQVKLYFKDFPLESLHPWAKAAAMAGRCVFQQSNDAFWAYHDWIYSHQEQITPDNVRAQILDWAKGQKNLDALKLGQCIDTKATEAEVDATEAQGRELGINATPTLFINGRRLAQAVDWASLKNIIDYEIEYQKTAKNAGDDCGCDLKLKLPGAPAIKH